jgi:hypothetical protein
MQLRALAGLLLLSAAAAACAPQTTEKPQVVSNAAAPVSPYTTLNALPDWTGSWATYSGDGTTGDEARTAFQDCCIGDGSHVPFTPKYAAVRRAFGAQEAATPGGQNVNNAASCEPAGVPAVLAHPIIFEFLFTPDRVTMIFIDGEIRKIHLNQQQHPPADEIDIGYSGHSIGHWDGNTLVVDTIHIDPRAEIFMANGIKVTANTQVAERIGLDQRGRLKIDTTVTDTAIFTKPFSYTLYYQRIPGEFEPSCAANNYDNGETFKVPDL